MADRKGRPEKISDEELRKILIEYATNNEGKINFLQLEKTTGIKRHVWARRMSTEIQRLNNDDLGINGDKFENIPLPNVIDTIEKYFGDKDELIKAFGSYNKYIQSLWEKALSNQKTEDKNIKLQEKIDKLEAENKFLKENRDYYKKEYEKIAVESTYANKRKEKNIDNVIDIKDKKDKLSAGNWEIQFPDLFK